MEDVPRENRWDVFSFLRLTTVATLPAAGGDTFVARVQACRYSRASSGLSATRTPSLLTSVAVCLPREFRLVGDDERRRYSRREIRLIGDGETPSLLPSVAKMPSLLPLVAGIEWIVWSKGFQ